MCVQQSLRYIYIEGLYKVHVAEKNIVWGIQVWSDPRDGTGRQAINYVYSQLSGKRRGIHLPVKRQPCVFNTLGSPSAYP